MSGLTNFLRRLFCGHHLTETVTTPTFGVGWIGVRRERSCVDCGKELRP